MAKFVVIIHGQERRLCTVGVDNPQEEETRDSIEDPSSHWGKAGTLIAPNKSTRPNQRYFTIIKVIVELAEKWSIYL